MIEDKSEYIVIDEDNNETKVVFTHRYCGCNSPGCVDDELEVFEDGDENPSSNTQIPRIITPYIEGLFDGSLKLKG